MIYGRIKSLKINRRGGGEERRGHWANTQHRHAGSGRKANAKGVKKPDTEVLEVTGYQDIKGFCNSASVARVKELDYVLTPGRYVGLPDDEDDFDFKERFTSLKKEFEEQLKEEERLNKAIVENLKKVKLV